MPARRAPYVSTSSLPDNGYIRDLAWAVEAAAKAHGAAVRVIRKNGDRYLAVLIPNDAELAAIEAESATATPAPDDLGPKLSQENN